MAEQDFSKKEILMNEPDILKEELFELKDVDNIIKEKFLLLSEVLDKMYLTEDNYANDIYLRDNVLKAMEEVLTGSYKEHKTCYNCKKEKNCKYKNKCKRSNPLMISTLDFFEKKS